MRALDIITRKRDGESLSAQEIEFLVAGYVNHSIPEYQISAWLMAVFLKGMSFEETGFLTRSMIASGSVFDLSGISGPLIDKHSTGGVGDKVSLILAPIVAAAGLRVPMMSGRGLGHTGGTLDKLDTIPGYSTALSQEQFRRILSECGFAMTGQTRDVVPADRLLYALRDVTATVESIPLITASILSKKFAEGAEGFVFDVKTGSGAFMKSTDDARKLAVSLVQSARSLGRKAVALLTDMSFPLGYAVGNFLEVEESYLCLQPDSGLWAARLEGSRLTCTGVSAELMELTLELGARMLMLGGLCSSREEGLRQCLAVIENGSALKKFEANVAAQGGDVQAMKKKIHSFRAPLTRSVVADRDGWWTGFDAHACGLACVYLGAGRNQASDSVLPDVGIILASSRNARVTRGQTLFTCYAHSESALDEASRILEGSWTIGDRAEAKQPLLREIIE